MALTPAPSVKRARTITTSRAAILAAVEHGLSNARVESVNRLIRLLTMPKVLSAG